MAYRLIILNGEQRGERRDIESHPLRVGRAPESGLRLNDPDVLPDHVVLTPGKDSLTIRCLSQDSPVQVNGVDTWESALQHGDVAQVGTTRLFVQALGNPVAWSNLARFSKLRIGIATALPLFLLLATTFLLRECRKPAKPASPPPSSVLPLVESALYPDDCLVTNIPQVKINDSVSLTSPPADVVEASEAINSYRPEPSQRGIAIAQVELDAAARFLEEAERLEIQHRAATNQVSGVADLTKAADILKEPNTTNEAIRAAPTNAPVQVPPP